MPAAPWLEPGTDIVDLYAVLSAEISGTAAYSLMVQNIPTNAGYGICAPNVNGSTLTADCIGYINTAGTAE